MRVSVTYAEIHQFWQTLEVDEGCTVEQAIQRSGVLNRFPEIDLDTQRVGVFGKVVKLDAPLVEGDRVEIYRPITADPETVARRDMDDDDE